MNINVHVYPITSPRSGEAVRNQYTIKGRDFVAFQSYDSLIAIYSNNRLTLGHDWDYSVTTMKYLWQWLREYCWSTVRELPNGKSGSDRIRKAIEDGTIAYDPEMR